MDTFFALAGWLFLLGWACHQLWWAYSRGYVLSRFNNRFTRREEPGLFWFLVTIYFGVVLATVALAAKLAAMALSPGEYVRITYLGDRILQLWAWQRPGL